MQCHPISTTATFKKSNFAFLSVGPILIPIVGHVCFVGQTGQTKDLNRSLELAKRPSGLCFGALSRANWPLR